MGLDPFPPRCLSFTLTSLLLCFQLLSDYLALQTVLPLSLTNNTGSHVWPVRSLELDKQDGKMAPKSGHTWSKGTARMSSILSNAIWSTVPYRSFTSSSVQDLSGGDHFEAIGRGPNRTLKGGAQALDEGCFKRRLCVVRRLMPVVCILHTRNLGVSHAHRDGNVDWYGGSGGDGDRSTW